MTRAELSVTTLFRKNLKLKLEYTAQAMTPSTTWTTNVKFGKHKNGENIILRAPEWACGWYWSFGYLVNRDRHYHLRDAGHRMHDSLLEDYELNPKIKESLWQFCEISLTIYTLKDTAEVLGHGGSHVHQNPCANLIKNPSEVARLNNVVIPKCLDTLYEIIKD